MSASKFRRMATVGALVLASLAAGFGLAPDAGSAPTFATRADATIYPGVQLVTGEAQCTANFVFTNGSEVYIGYAAHCAAGGDSTATDGCRIPALPLGTPVQIEGATRPGSLAYSSWGAMQAIGETDPATCDGNDFALVRIDPADHQRVNPTVKHWGGPTSIATGPIPITDGLRAYGNSGLRLGLTPVSPMVGLTTGTSGGGWVRNALTVLPAIPGDSGMPLMTERGAAVGLLSSITLFPSVGQLNFTDLAHALAYARSHGLPNLQLAFGERINLAQLPLDL